MPISQADLKINRNNLDKDLLTQADLFYQAAVAAAEAGSVADAAKDKIKRLEGELVKVVRTKLQRTEDRVTEAMVTAGVQSHEDMVKAKRRLTEATKEAALADALVEAFKQRSYMIKELCENHRTRTKMPDTHYGDRADAAQQYVDRAEQERKAKVDEKLNKVADHVKKNGKQPKLKDYGYKD